MKHFLKILFASFILSLGIFCFGNVSSVKAITLTDDTQVEFDAGTYSETQWDMSNSGVELTATGQSNGLGNYISSVKDANENSQWTSVAWVPNRPIGKELPNNAQSEITYSTGNANMTGNVLLMHMNESSGAITDTSGQGNNSDAYNNLTYSTTGKLNTSLQFNGVSSYIRIANSTSSDITSNTITVGAWINPTTTTLAEQTIVRKGNKFILRVKSGGKLDANLYISGAWRGSWSSATGTISANSWQYVSFTYDGSLGSDNVKLYINGSEASPASNDQTGNLGSETASLYVGTQLGPVNLFNGAMDELAIWNRALSATEIADIYKRGALRLKFQVRSCDDANCSGESFIGSDGTGSTYYEWGTTNSTSTPSFALTHISSNRYFQYKAYFETDNAAISPELKSVDIGYHASQVPNTPTNVSPANSTTSVDLNSILQGSSYSDSELDPQTDTEWQVDDDSDFSSPVWTRTAGSAETSTVVNATRGTFANELAGETALGHNTTYYWKVRYSDNGWSERSSATNFTTSANVLFSDNFDDNSIDVTKWIEHDTAGDYIQESNGKINLVSSGNWETTALFSQNNFTRAANVTFMATINHLAAKSVIYGFKDSDTSYSYTNMVYGLYFYGADRSFIVYEDNNNRGVVGSGWSTSTDYRIAIVLQTTGAKYYIQGGSYGAFGSNTWTLLYDSSYSSESNLKAGFTSKTSSENVMTLDNVSVTDSGLPIGIQNKMIAKPTQNSVTILVKTNLSSDVTIDYGLTDSYGSSVSSTNQTIHEILISGLNPSTEYHYKVTASKNSNSEDSTSTSDSTFKTQLELGNDFSFVIMSDNQGHNFSDSVTQIQALAPDIIITAGDNVKGTNLSTGSVSEYSNAWQTEMFDYLQNLTDHIPLFTTLGNHDDALKGNYNDAITAYQQEVSMPTSTSGGEKYYSFDYGDAHFTILNGTYNGGGSGGTIDSTQLTWLQNDLQSTSKKWKFVICHYLIYGVDNTAMTSTWRLSNYTDVATVLKNNGVTAWFDGHRHVYNRYVKDGVFYITNPATQDTILDGQYGDDNYANSGGDAGTISNAIGIYNGFTKVSVLPSEVSVTIYQRDGTIIDDFVMTSPKIPTISVPTTLSSSAIRWNFTDNSSYEISFRVYTNADAIATSSATANLTYLDETGLSENTQYTRYVKAYNSYGESASSSATSTYTLADTPTGFNFMRHPSSLDIYVDSFPNDTSGSSGYLFWRTDNSSYNSGWIQTREWRDPNMVEGTTYTYAVRYRNGDGLETATTTMGGVSFVRDNGGGGAPTIPQQTTSTSSRQATTTSATSTQISATITQQTSTTSIPNLAGLTGQARQVAIQQIRDMITQIQKQLIVLISQLIQVLQQEIAKTISH
jgi:hypothetical protein